MSDDVLVKVDNVSKRFCRSLKRSLWYGLQDLGSEIGGPRHGGGSGLPQSSADVQLRPDEFWAVKDVSFELRRGECLGLIGRNGAGKTTLLRMLNGLIKPDTGQIRINGRVGALIALGAGFNPILTGRENIYTNASVLGLSKREIDAQVDEIIEFADIGDFIDTPVQSYSSGMQVRLGFAIASSLKPDILIIDEVLAVGDGNFKVKCANRIRERLSDTCVLFVSHSMEQVSQICNKAYVMKKGSRIYSGDVLQGIEEYFRISEEGQYKSMADIVYSQTTISEIQLIYKESTEDINATSIGISFLSKKKYKDVSASLFFVNPELKPVLEVRKNFTGNNLRIDLGYNEIIFGLPDIPLTPGKYTFDFHLNDKSDGFQFILRLKLNKPILVSGRKPSYAAVILEDYNLSHSVGC